MFTNDDMLRVFERKLQATNSLDEAFKKVCWIAYTEGVLDGIEVDDPSKALLTSKLQEILRKGYGE